MLSAPIPRRIKFLCTGSTLTPMSLFTCLNLSLYISIFLHWSAHPMSNQFFTTQFAPPILMSFYVFLYLPCKMLWDPHIKCFVWVRFQPGGQILYSILACISGHPYQPTISLPCCCFLQGAMSCGHVWHLPKGQELPADNNNSARGSLPTGSTGGCCLGRIQQNCAVRPTSSYNFS